MNDFDSSKAWANLPNVWLSYVRLLNGSGNTQLKKCYKKFSFLSQKLKTTNSPNSAYREFEERVEGGMYSVLGGSVESSNCDAGT